MVADTRPRNPREAEWIKTVAELPPRMGTVAKTFAPITPHRGASTRSRGSSPRSVPRTSEDPSGWRITTIVPGGTDPSLPVAAFLARLRASIASESRGEFLSANAIST